MNAAWRAKAFGLLTRCIPRSMTARGLAVAWLAAAWLAWSHPISRASLDHPADRQAVDFRLGVNAASAEELVSLHGIGPALADRIVEHRQAHGPFTDAGDLQAVSGIGPRTAARIGPWLTFD